MHRRCVYRLVARKVLTFLSRMFPKSSDCRPEQDLNKCVRLVSERPQDPRVHYQLAETYSLHKRWIPAIAEYRVTIALGNIGPEVLMSLAKAYLAIGQVDLAVSTCQVILGESENNTLKQQARSILAMFKTKKSWPLTNFDHNRYYRIKTVANHLLDLFPSSDFSVLDVGGGDGVLALFIPKARYVLAEPSVNGVSGIALPFAEKSFDVTVACHVLEHISEGMREQFLDQLCSKARQYVLLLNPFHDPDGYVDERLTLVEEITNAQWAKEHLKVGLPKLEWLKAFALKRHYDYKILPHGSLTTSLAMVFVEHYATLAGRTAELEKINNLYNCRFVEQLTNPQFPVAQLVEFNVGE